MSIKQYHNRSKGITSPEHLSVSERIQELRDNRCDKAMLRYFSFAHQDWTLFMCRQGGRPTVYEKEMNTFRSGLDSDEILKNMVLLDRCDQAFESL